MAVRGVKMVRKFRGRIRFQLKKMESARLSMATHDGKYPDARIFTVDELAEVNAVGALLRQKLALKVGV